MSNIDEKLRQQFDSWESSAIKCESVSNQMQMTCSHSFVTKID